MRRQQKGSAEDLAAGTHPSDIREKEILAIAIEVRLRVRQVLILEGRHVSGSQRPTARQTLLRKESRLGDLVVRLTPVTTLGPIGIRNLLGRKR